MVSPSEFRAANSGFPSGVTVLTSLRADGAAYGMTASSFTSVSLHPPLVLVCVDKKAAMAEILAVGTQYLINVLREDQQHLAQRFAAKADRERFTGVAYEPSEAGIPKLEGAIVIFSCQVERLIDAGDHFIVLSLVHAVEMRPGRPLVWCERGYHCLPAAARL